MGADRVLAMAQSVVELLEHFRDDVHLQPLFQQLDALSERVKVGAILPLEGAEFVGELGSLQQK